MLLRYDGSWKGFLSLLNRADMLAPEELPELIVRHGGREGTLAFEEGEFVPAVERDARKVHGMLAGRLGARGAWVLSRAQAAGREDVDTLLARLWAAPQSLGREERIGLREWAGRTAFEVHRYQGILRLFPLGEGVMYAPLRPRFAVLPFLGVWLSGRFPGTPLLLHDHGRGLFRWYLSCRGGSEGEGRWREAKQAFPELPAEDLLVKTAGLGDEVQECWKRYAASTAIRERKNSVLQRSFLPKKYREFLPELRDQ